MKRVRVDVTKRDIEKGVRCDGVKCPVALAIGRALGLSRSISVDGEDLVIFSASSNVGRYFRLSQKAQKFTRDFDDGKRDVKPFSFTLRFD